MIAVGEDVYADRFDAAQAVLELGIKRDDFCEKGPNGNTAWYEIYLLDGHNVRLRWIFTQKEWRIFESGRPAEDLPWDNGTMEVIPDGDYVVESRYIYYVEDREPSGRNIYIDGPFISKADAARSANDQWFYKSDGEKRKYTQYGGVIAVIRKEPSGDYDTGICYPKAAGISKFDKKTASRNRKPRKGKTINSRVCGDKCDKPKGKRR